MRRPVMRSSRSALHLLCRLRPRRGARNEVCARQDEIRRGDGLTASVAVFISMLRTKPPKARTALKMPDEFEPVLGQALTAPPEPPMTCHQSRAGCDLWSWLAFCGLGGARTCHQARMLRPSWPCLSENRCLRGCVGSARDASQTCALAHYLKGDEAYRAAMPWWSGVLLAASDGARCATLVKLVLLEHNTSHTDSAAERKGTADWWRVTRPPSRSPAWPYSGSLSRMQNSHSEELINHAPRCWLAVQRAAGTTRIGRALLTYNAPPGLR